MKLGINYIRLSNHSDLYVSERRCIQELMNAVETLQVMDPANEEKYIRIQRKLSGLENSIIHKSQIIENIHFTFKKLETETNREFDTITHMLDKLDQ